MHAARSGPKRKCSGPCTEATVSTCKNATSTETCRTQPRKFKNVVNSTYSMSRSFHHTYFPRQPRSAQRNFPQEASSISTFSHAECFPPKKNAKPNILRTDISSWQAFSKQTPHPTTIPVPRYTMFQPRHAFSKPHMFLAISRLNAKFFISKRYQCGRHLCRIFFSSNIHTTNSQCTFTCKTFFHRTTLSYMTSISNIKHFPQPKLFNNRLVSTKQLPRKNGPCKLFCRAHHSPCKV